MADAYQTVDQAAYWGDAKGLLDIGRDVLGVAIQSELRTEARVTLGSRFPRLYLGQVDYRVAPASMLAATAVAMRAKPKATLAVIQTDAVTAMVMDAIVSSLPRTAAAQGVITTQPPIAPAGPVHRCTANDFNGAGTHTVAASDEVFVVVTAGASNAGRITRGSSRVSTPNSGIYRLTGNSTTVTVTANLAGWILHGPAIGGT